MVGEMRGLKKSYQFKKKYIISKSKKSTERLASFEKIAKMRHKRFPICIQSC